jgi:hypothetical protein
MIRVVTIILFLALPVLACVSTAERRKAALGPSDDPCLDVGADCQSSSACCSQWCVNGTCEMRDP